MTSANKNERNVPPSVVGCGFVRNKFARVDPFVLLENTYDSSVLLEAASSGLGFQGVRWVKKK